MTVIDVHTHMLTLEWIDMLRRNGGDRYEVKKTKAGQDSIFLDNVAFMTLMPGMWDYDLRIKAMDAAGVDVAIVSLTCPNVFWGDRATSLATAQQVNDSMAEQQRAKPDRIRWFASMPWQYVDDAKQELARAVNNGAVGVMVLANIAGTDLTDLCFASCSAVIKDKPSNYLQRIWYDTVVYDDGALNLCIATAGSADRVLYGSDYPHNIGDMAGCLARVRSRPAGEAARIAGRNAERLFRI